MKRSYLPFLAALTLFALLAREIRAEPSASSETTAASDAPASIAASATPPASAQPPEIAEDLRRKIEDAMAMSETVLSGAVSYERRHWIEQMTCDLADAYRATGEEAYARRAALLLDRLAQLYPSYADSAVRQGNRPTDADESGLSRFPAPRDLWFSNRLPLAYDAIRASKELGDLSRRRGYDAGRKIENDFLRRMAELIMAADAARSVPPGPQRVGKTAGDAPGPSAFWRLRDPLAAAQEAPLVLAAARIGRTLEEPHYIRWARQRVGEILEYVQYDGTLRGEVPGFASHLGNTLPPIADVLVLDDDDIGRDLPLMTVLRDDPWRRIALPTGPFPLGETRGLMIEETQGAAAGPPEGNKLDPPARVDLLGALGHAVLRAGSNRGAIQVNLSFSQTTGPRRHADFLGLGLSAFGREMLSDFGSTPGTLSGWARSAQAHNAVVVDDAQDGGGVGAGSGRVDLIVSRPGLLSAVAAGVSGAAGVSPAMRRLIVLVDAPPGSPYLLDLFAVRGGRRHDYVLHGSAVGNMEADANVPLERSDVPVFSIPPNVESERRQGVARKAWNVAFRRADRLGEGVRIHDAGCGATTLTLCRTPSRRGAIKAPEMPSSGDCLAPRLVVRREGAAPLASVFAVVIEPFEEGPWIESVEEAPLTSGSLAAAVRVKMGAVCHTIVAALGEEPARVETADGLVFDGRLGFLAEEDGQIVRAVLVGGREMSKGALRLESPAAAWTGTIESARDERIGDAVRGAFSTSADLAGDPASRGDWIVVNHDKAASHAYPIERIEPRADGEAGKNAQTKIVLREIHGLEVVRGFVTREKHYPKREFQRRSDFRIDSAAEFAAQAANP